MVLKGLGLPVVGLLLGASAQEGYDLAWKLPHDRAAPYEVFDAARGTKTGEFWLLGCELDSRVGANGYSDLPYRFLFRLPKDRVPASARWQIDEFVFAEAPGLMSPLQVTGSYRIRELKKAKLDDHLKAALRARKQRPQPSDLLVLEGQLEMFRSNWVNGKPVRADPKSSLNLATQAFIRPTDLAIVGGRFVFGGRVEDFAKLSGVVVAKVEETRELLLTEPLIELSKNGLKERIDKAIQSGAEWLKSQQSADGRFADRTGYPIGTVAGSGATGLSLAALLHSGVANSDTAIAKAFAHIASKRLNQSYDLSLCLMALEAKYISVDSLTEKELRSEEAIRNRIVATISRQDKDMAVELARLLLECQGNHGSFGYTKGIDEPNLSNTQYALLGLKAASRMGVAVPAVVWKQSASAVLQAGVAHGMEIQLDIARQSGTTESVRTTPNGWGYYMPRPSNGRGWATGLTATMTTAAISSLAICRSEIDPDGSKDGPFERRINNTILSGLAWLKLHYGLRGCRPEGAWWGTAMQYYHLYSLERAGILAGVVKLADHDWYLEGAAVLLSWQRKDGRWEGCHITPVVDTAFALLFLKRATIPVATPSADSKK